MIRKLNENDRLKVLNYLSRNSSINLFIIGDIENFGFNDMRQDVWGKFDKNNEIKAVLLRYSENFIPYYDDLNEDVSGFKEIISSYKGSKLISGEEHIVEQFKPLLKNKKEKNTYFCELINKTKLKGFDKSVKIAKKDDAIRICKLIDTIEEFKDTPRVTEESVMRKIKDRSGRVYYIENEKKEIISVAQTTAENSKSTMVVGVATKLEYRNMGLVSKCLSKLCYDVLNEGKNLCLFYDNPKAGKIYHSIGFTEIGKWTMLIEK
ncbi:GNAT family N-acetyltransferase [Romboutsia weinsteinii]|uniref:GNAT family N-acetyltransferase n=1 Tax=Romboutsia weinsteinii TaxID=2020949 RepID=A0A371J1W1_9FIRM|nr:GNAT family N-acetyltransferase [Romboutsia weinsteinii]RDY26769.1 GNAT family N-acetyltransferase [Romboutsia weinsteinii]